MMDNQFTLPTDSESKDYYIIEAPQICRICLNTQPLEFISPCSCSGTSKFAHKNCLKTWILMKYPTLFDPKCEVCTGKYKIEVKTILKCKRNFFNGNSLMNFLIITFALFGLFACLIITYKFSYSLVYLQKSKVLGLVTISLTLTPSFLYMICIYTQFSNFCIIYEEEDFEIYDKQIKDDEEKKFI